KDPGLRGSFPRLGLGRRWEGDALRHYIGACCARPGHSLRHPRAAPPSTGERTRGAAALAADRERIAVHVSLSKCGMGGSLLRGAAEVAEGGDLYRGPHFIGSPAMECKLSGTQGGFPKCLILVSACLPKDHGKASLLRRLGELDKW